MKKALIEIRPEDGWVVVDNHQLATASVAFIPPVVSFVGASAVGKTTMRRVLTSTAIDTLQSLPETTSDIHMEYSSQMEWICLDSEGYDKHPLSAQMILRLQGWGSVLWDKEEYSRVRQHHVLHSFPKLLYASSDVICYVTDAPWDKHKEVASSVLEWATSGAAGVLHRAALPHLIVIFNKVSLTAIEVTSFSKTPLLQQFTQSAMNKQESVTDDSRSNSVSSDIASSSGYMEAGAGFSDDLESPPSTRNPFAQFFAQVEVILIPHFPDRKAVNQSVVESFRDTLRSSAVQSKHNRCAAGQGMTWPIFQQVLTHSALACNRRSRLDMLSLPRPQHRNQQYLLSSSRRTDQRSHLPTLTSSSAERRRLSSFLIAFFDCVTSEFGTQIATRLLQDRLTDVPFLHLLRTSRLGTATGKPGLRFPGPWERLLEDDIESYVHQQIWFEMGSQQEEHLLQQHHQQHFGSTTSLASANQNPYYSSSSVHNSSRHSSFDAEVEMKAAASVYRLSIAHTTSQLHLFGYVNDQLESYPTWDPSAIYAHHTQLLMEQSTYLTHLTSTEVCFACLLDVPTHPLICEHTVCRTCYETLHRRDGRCCPFCRAQQPHQHEQPQVASNHPLYSPSRLMGSRILALDGGGIRGLVQLMVMEEIERTLGMSIKVLVDYIIGTSTGGVIAAHLSAATFEWASEGKARIQEVMQAAFGAPNTGSQVPGLNLLLQFFNVAMYDVTAFEHYLRKEYGDKRLLHSAGGQLHCGITACIDEDGFPSVLFTSYNRYITPSSVDIARQQKTENGYNTYPDAQSDSRGKKRIHIHEISESCHAGDAAQDPLSRLGSRLDYTIFDAVRATSAAALFFPPYVTHERQFTDGGLRHNNPSELALQETQRLWPDKHCDCVLSLGTGQVSDPNQLTTAPGETHTGDIIKLLGHVINLVTSGQGIWDRVVSTLDQQYDHFPKESDHTSDGDSAYGDGHEDVSVSPSSYRALRIDPSLPRKIPFNAVESVENGELEALTTAYLTSEHGAFSLQHTCARLFSCLFYLSDFNVMDLPPSQTSSSSTMGTSRRHATFTLRSRAPIPIKSRALLISFQGGLYRSPEAPVVDGSLLTIDILSPQNNTAHQQNTQQKHRHLSARYKEKAHTIDRDSGGSWGTSPTTTIESSDTLSLASPLSTKTTTSMNANPGNRTGNGTETQSCAVAMEREEEEDEEEDDEDTNKIIAVGSIPHLPWSLPVFLNVTATVRIKGRTFHFPISGMPCRIDRW